ncbi:MAG: tight adherence protein C [Zhongshania aliphaticivorans]|jgi:tight adherence protein C|uniref:type II secretion system F family protein n=1 Tax=Zhongshania aliphaticivorans TaxID=1470434 RepID=UPI00025C151D|nr:type II secretion system protein [gamma proteobacterium BDW918]
MNESWWFDLGVLVLLMFIGAIALKMRSGGIEQVTEKEFDGFDVDDDKRRFSVYPRKLIRQSGYSPEKLFWVYWISKVVLAVLVPMVLLEIFQEGLLLWAVLLIGVVSFVVIDLWFLLARKSRRSSIERSLSFFVNLMVVYLKSGLSLTRAFDSAAQYGLSRKNPLSQEVGLLLREIDAGRARDEAFTRLAKRTGVQDLRRLAAVLNVGFKVGSPVADTLEAQAQLLRARQAQQGTALVNRKTMEAMLPMLMVCFPMFIVLIFYPAGAQVIEVMAALKDLF